MSTSALRATFYNFYVEEAGTFVYVGRPMEDGERKLAYKHCTIFYSSRLDSDLIKYIPTAAISWQTGMGTATTCFLRLLQPEPTKDKAESAALEQAKAWIDRVKPAAS